MVTQHSVEQLTMLCLTSPTHCTKELVDVGNLPARLHQPLAMRSPLTLETFCCLPHIHTKMPLRADLTVAQQLKIAATALIVRATAGLQ